MPHRTEAIRLSGLPTPTVCPGEECGQGEPRVVTHVPATSAPESPHMNVKVEDGRDVSGITGIGAMAEGARLVSQFGIPSAVLGTFLVIFVAGLWFVRRDYLAADAAKTDAHERVMTTQIEANDKTTARLIETFERLRKEDREDRRSDRLEVREHHSKMWRGMTENTQAVRECNATMAKTADLLGLQIGELKKIVNK